MARGEETGRHPNRQVGRNRAQVQRIVTTLGTNRDETQASFDATSNPDGLEHQLYRGFFKRVKDNMINKGYNTDLDDPNTPEYTGQEARLSDLAPRNIIDKMKGGTGQVPKEPLFSWDENNNPSFRGKKIK